VLSPRVAIIGALRVHRFTIANDPGATALGINLSAFSIRPMVGARLTF